MQPAEGRSDRGRSQTPDLLGAEFLKPFGDLGEKRLIMLLGEHGKLPFY